MKICSSHIPVKGYRRLQANRLTAVGLAKQRLALDNTPSVHVRDAAHFHRRALKWELEKVMRRFNNTGPPF